MPYNDKGQPIGSRHKWEINDTHTLDGVPVVKGLRAWDYDLELVEVEADPSESRDGWFYCRRIGEGKSGRSLMNASRLWKWHPSSGKEAQ
jgi:hypothetical protein